MARLRSRGFVIGGVAVVWYLVVLVWAFQPLHETLPVGIDYTASPPSAVSVTVECNSLLSSTAMSQPAPTLTPQPEGQPSLAYPHEPCGLVRSDARTAFVIDTVVMLLAVVALVLYRRRRRGDQAAVPDDTFVG